MKSTPACSACASVRMSATVAEHPVAGIALLAGFRDVVASSTPARVRIRRRSPARCRGACASAWPPAVPRWSSACPNTPGSLRWSRRLPCSASRAALNSQRHRVCKFVACGTQATTLRPNKCKASGSACAGAWNRLWRNSPPAHLKYCLPRPLSYDRPIFRQRSAPVFLGSS